MEIRVSSIVAILILLILLLLGAVSCLRMDSGVTMWRSPDHLVKTTEDSIIYYGNLFNSQMTIEEFLGYGHQLQRTAKDSLEIIIGDRVEAFYLIEDWGATHPWDSITVRIGIDLMEFRWLRNYTILENAALVESYQAAKIHRKIPQSSWACLKHELNLISEDTFDIFEYEGPHNILVYQLNKYYRGAAINFEGRATFSLYPCLDQWLRDRAGEAVRF